ncbi:MAG: 3-keto-5-aminohexanoate cleavage protein [Clostridia bacterium]|jgi:3-keto-5-aminohexanoate cleavage enzyme|nr:3-keto-5-aminohexanoate cleavage protein [Clostridia bacterium]MCI2000562.1 3-keto-5-aminohexanoate cleavage protein [Clostridia bacterium]MCI2015018.1 3-keto-5-aminohexanoate cleavage protein [Clostridia bacterium]
MKNKVILSVAAVSPTDKNINPKKIADDVIACSKAGAAMVHLHVRDYEGNLTSNLSVVKETVDLIKKESDIIIQISTGGVSNLTIEQRCAPLYMDTIEATSLNVGSVNLGKSVYCNPIDDVKYCVGKIIENKITPEVEVFELGMINTTELLRKEFSFKNPLLYSVVLGHEGAAPATPEALSAMVGYLPKNKNTLWGITHANRKTFDIIAAAIGMGASVVRIGFEDSVYLNENTKAENNLQILQAVVSLVNDMDKEPATPDDARQILNIRKKR